MDQSSPKFFHPTRRESWYKVYLSDFEYLHPLWRYSLLKFEVVQNRAKFCMFWAPKIFRGRAPEILARHYKIWPSTDHRAKFGADQPTHLGDLATAINKTSAVKHKSFQKLSFPGRLKSIQDIGWLHFLTWTFGEKIRWAKFWSEYIL